MAYTTHWDLLDADKKVVKSYTRVCFSNHVGTPFAEAVYEGEDDDDDEDQPNIIQNGDSAGIPRYFRYKFHNTVMDDDQIEKYFRFLKAIPEFKHLMPHNIKKLVKDQYYDADILAMNGTQLFTILTLLRAVVEDPPIVESVILFDPKFKYSMPLLGILKAAGSKNSENHNHWITNYLDKTSLYKGIKDLATWNDPKPALYTGLVRGIHDVFQHDGDGYMINNRIPSWWHHELIDEQRRHQAAKAKRAIKKQNKLNLAKANVLKPYVEDPTMGLAYA